MKRRNLFTDFASSASRPVVSQGPAYYTNAVLRTQDNKEVRFYDDLIKGKHVVINFMYANCEGSCPAITSNLLKFQKALNGPFGKNSSSNSLTLKPKEDTPQPLKKNAKSTELKSG